MTNVQPTRRPRAVLYSRLSRATLESTSLLGQAEDLEGLAEREGWDVVALFVDEGLSGGKRRANAEEALRMIRDNEADVLAAYSVDRYSRMGIGEDAEVIRVIDGREAQHKRGHTPRPLAYFAREGIRSDSGSDWRLRYALSSEMARNERDVMVSRRKVSIRRLQAEGRFSGRGPAPWGYRSAPNPNGAGRILVPDPTEADVIRATADRLISGESGTAVARDLTRAGVPTPRSPYRLALLKDEPTEGLATGMWSSANLSQSLLSQHLLGRIPQRTNRSTDDGLGRSGVLVLDREGNPLQAFEPVLDLATHLALVDRFSRGVGRGQQRLRRAARLGSGLVFCGLCGGKCYVQSSASDSYVAYRCSTKTRGGLDCPGLRVSADLVERAIEEHFLKSFGRLPAVEHLSYEGAPDQADAILRLTERIRNLTTAMGAPGADIPALALDLATLSQERDALMALPSTTQSVTRALGGSWAEVWAGATLEARRKWLLDAYDHFSIYPVGAPERVVATIKPSPEESPEYHGR